MNSNGMVPAFKIHFGEVTSPFGAVDSVHIEPHTGIDFAVPMETELHAPFEGVVSAVRDYGDASLGKAVFVKLESGEHYALGHLSDIKVKVGEIVQKGDLLALSGSSGRSTGPHLHFSMYNQSGEPLNPGNIDFTAFIEQVKPDPAWWDLPGQAEAAVEAIKAGMVDGWHDFWSWVGDGLLSLLDVGLPTLACIGILWWMFSFLPKPEYGPRLTGASLIIYMFYVLIRGAA